MEGLIPMVYKRIKRSVSHRHYKCLSTTGGADFYLTNFNDDGDHHLRLAKYYRDSPLPEARPASHEEVVYGNGHGIRRSSSLDSRIRHADERPCGFGGNPGGEYLDQDPTRTRQMVQFRSHSRSMFSCITG